jgi:hypothetical protein
MASEADYCVSFEVKGVGLLEFDAIKKIVDIGYQAAIDVCTKIKNENC